MDELLALAGRHVRSALRTRATWVLAVLHVALVLIAVGLFGGASGGGNAVWLVLSVLCLLVIGVGASAGGALPGDRLRGREAWLRAHGPAPWMHRLAPVLAGAFLALAVGVLGGLVASAAVTIGASSFRVRSSTSVPLARDTAGRLPRVAVALEGRPPPPPVVVTLPAPVPAGGRRLEVVFRPHFDGRAAHRDDVGILHGVDGGALRPLAVNVHQPLRIDLPAGATRVALRHAGPHVGLGLRRARLLAPPRGPFMTLLVAGLLLGLMAACATPVAVLVSRFTSGATASAAALAVLLHGAVHDALLGMTAAVSADGGVAVATSVLGALGSLTPDIAVLEGPLGTRGGARCERSGSVAPWLPRRSCARRCVARRAAGSASLAKGHGRMSRRAMLTLGVLALALAGALAPPAPGRAGARPSVLASVGASLGGLRVLLVDVLFLRAGALQKSGQPEEAAALYETVMELDPENDSATAYLADLYVDALLPQSATAEGHFAVVA